MIKKFFLVNIIFIITSGALACAQINPFADLMAAPDNSADNEIIASAQQMYQKLTQGTSAAMPDMPIAAEGILNPFISKIPQPENPAPMPEDKDQQRFAIPQNITAPKGAEPPPMPNYKISGLVWNTQKPQAILDNTIVTIGDNLKGWTIVDISKEGILIEFTDQTQYFIEP